MKTAKLIIGIISIVLFGVILFQSCAAGIGNAIEDNGESSGSAGVFVALCMLIAGIVAIAARKGKAGGFVAGGFYTVAGLMGLINYGSFSDLKIWSILCLIFAAVLILGGILTKSKKQEKKPGETDKP